jgi:hypothetical protein
MLAFVFERGRLVKSGVNKVMKNKNILEQTYEVIVPVPNNWQPGDLVSLAIRNLPFLSRLSFQQDFCSSAPHFILLSGRRLDTFGARLD